MTAEKVKIYTDGACRGNPGPGGWGAVLKFGRHTREISGRAEHTTNNRMELTAAIKALEVLKRPVEVELYSDSVYLVRGMNEWLACWRRCNWKLASNRPVKNRELWERLAQLNETHRVTWIWVKGHDDNPLNERADQLANQAMSSPEAT